MDLNKFPFVPFYFHFSDAKRKLVAIKKGETESKSTFRYLYFFIIKPLNPNHHEEFNFYYSNNLITFNWSLHQTK
jgi:hypothetical protein